MESLYIGFVAGALLNVAVVDVSNVVGNNANASILNFGETLADNIAGYIDATATLNENNNSFTNCEIIF